MLNIDYVLETNVIKRFFRMVVGRMSPIAWEEELETAWSRSS